MSASQSKKARRAARFAMADTRAQILETFCQCYLWPGPHVETDRCRKHAAAWRRALKGLFGS